MFRVHTHTQARGVRPAAAVPTDGGSVGLQAGGAAPQCRHVRDMWVRLVSAAALPRLCRQVLRASLRLLAHINAQCAPTGQKTIPQRPAVLGATPPQRREGVGTAPPRGTQPAGGCLPASQGAARVKARVSCATKIGAQSGVAPRKRRARVHGGEDGNDEGAHAGAQRPGASSSASVSQSVSRGSVRAQVGGLYRGRHDAARGGQKTGASTRPQRSGKGE